MTWLVEYSAPNDDTLPAAAQSPSPRVVYGIYLENMGRSELSDIRLTFQGGEFEVAASPQLSVTQSKQLDPNGDPVNTVTIASLAPGGAGVLIGTLLAPGGRFTVEPTGEANFRVHYSVDQVNRTRSEHSHVRFAGARQLSNTAFITMSVDELFARQQAAFGLDSLPLPIEPVELSATGENFDLRGPFMVCRSTFSGDYGVSSIVRRRPPVQSGAQANAPQAP